MDKFLKILDFVLVIAAIVLAVYVGKNIGLEYLMRGGEEPVTLSMTKEGLPEDYIGRQAGDDIPRVENAESWEEARATDYITIQPVGIISTGVGALHPWIDPYSTPTRRNRGGWKASVITNMALDIFNEYGEFYLLQLPDESYILAQLPMEEVRKLKMGKETTLPVGRKIPLNMQAKSSLDGICYEYDVPMDDVFYCINDKWNGSHEFGLLLLRIGIAVLVLFSFGIAFIMLAEKIFKREKSQNP